MLANLPSGHAARPLSLSLLAITQEASFTLNACPVACHNSFHLHLTKAQQASPRWRDKLLSKHCLHLHSAPSEGPGAGVLQLLQGVALRRVPEAYQRQTEEHSHSLKAALTLTKGPRDQGT